MHLVIYTFNDNLKGFLFPLFNVKIKLVAFCPFASSFELSLLYHSEVVGPEIKSQQLCKSFPQNKTVANALC